MKKLLKVGLLAVLATTLFACGTPSSSEAPTPSEEPTTEAPTSSEPTSTVEPSQSEQPSETVTTWTVTFYLNNGTDGVYKTLTVEHGKKITETISEPTRDGYAFSGWYVDAAGTIVFDEADETITGDKSIYASWVYSGIANPDTPADGGEGGDTGDTGDTEFVLPEGAQVEAPTAGYALLITTANGDTYYYPLTPGEEFEGFSQHVGLGLEINEGDNIKLYDGTNSASWAEDNLNPYSIAGCFTASADGITCNTSGTYDVYAKFKWEADEVYIGPAGA